MINKIRYFIKLRKQNDTVKIIVLFVIAGLVSAVSILYHAGLIYHYVKTPVEYVLTADHVISTEQIGVVQQMEGVSRVSRQIEIPVTLRYQGAETEMQAVLLSQEYVEEMFGVKLPSGGSRIFMDKKTFSSVQTEWQDSREGSVEVKSRKLDDGRVVLDVRYRIAETTADDLAGDDAVSNDGVVGNGEVEQLDRPAQIIVAGSGVLGEETFVCLADTENRLPRETCSLRVQYENHDLDGLHVEQLTKLGYTIENEEMVLGEKYEIQIKLLHIRYGLVICAICLAGVFGLGKVIRD